MKKKLSLRWDDKIPIKNHLISVNTITEVNEYEC